MVAAPVRSVSLREEDTVVPSCCARAVMASLGYGDYRLNYGNVWSVNVLYSSEEYVT